MPITSLFFKINGFGFWHSCLYLGVLGGKIQNWSKINKNFQNLKGGKSAPPPRHLFAPKGPSPIGLSVAIFEQFFNYTISSRTDSQVIFMKALELTNAKLTEKHINDRLQSIKFLNTSATSIQETTPTQIMTYQTHEIISLVNLSLPFTIIALIGLIFCFLHLVGRKVPYDN